MKLGLSMWSVVAAVRTGQIDLPGFIDFAAEQGAEGVELLDYFWQNEAMEILQVKQQAADAGLAIATYSIGNDLIQPDADARTSQVSDIRRAVDVANALETPLVRVFSGNAKGEITLDEGLAWIIDGLAAGAHYAQANGVTLALENHGLLAGRSDQVRHIIEAVDSPALRANLDTGNFLLVDQNPTQAARELAELIALVHLKDFRRARADETGDTYKGLDGTPFTGAVVGEGEVDLAQIVETLRNAGYDGWLSLEYEGHADPLSIGVPQSLAAARALL